MRIAEFEEQIAALDWTGCEQMQEALDAFVARIEGALEARREAIDVVDATRFEEVMARYQQR